jgi:hypothetical protein
MPSSIYNDAWSDNQLFFEEKFLFDSTYFSFVLQLLQCNKITPVRGRLHEQSFLTIDSDYELPLSPTDLTLETIQFATE